MAVAIAVPCTKELSWFSVPCIIAQSLYVCQVWIHSLPSKCAQSPQWTTGTLVTQGRALVGAQKTTLSVAPEKQKTGIQREKTIRPNHNINLSHLYHAAFYELSPMPKCEPSQCLFYVLSYVMSLSCSRPSCNEVASRAAHADAQL